MRCSLLATSLLLASNAEGLVVRNTPLHGFTISDDRVEERGHSINSTALQQLPECSRTCQDIILPRHSCTLDGECFCADDDIFHNLTTCVQTHCPTLQNLLDWQRFRAATCQIPPRNLNALHDDISYAFFAVASLFVVARLAARVKKFGGPGFWWDDWIALIIYLFDIQLVICLHFVKIYHAGEDSWTPTITIADMRSTLFWVWLNQPFYFIGTYGAKLTLALLYLRSSQENCTFRKICWIVVICCAVLCIGFGIGGMVTKWPWHYYRGDSAIVRRWEWGIDFFVALLTSSAMNVALDFVVLVLPVTKIAYLHGISRKRRLSIAAIFLLGFVATASSIARIVYIVPLRNSTNIAWDIGNFGLWCEVETHLLIMVCNLPPAAGLFYRIRFCRPRDLSQLSYLGSSSTDIHVKGHVTTIMSANAASASTVERNNSELDTEACAG